MKIHKAILLALAITMGSIHASESLEKILRDVNSPHFMDENHESDHDMTADLHHGASHHDIFHDVAHGDMSVHHDMHDLGHTSLAHHDLSHEITHTTTIHDHDLHADLHHNMHDLDIHDHDLHVDGHHDLLHQTSHAAAHHPAAHAPIHHAAAHAATHAVASHSVHHQSEVHHEEIHHVEHHHEVVHHVQEQHASHVQHHNIHGLLSSIQSDFTDHGLESLNHLPEIKNKNYETWIRRISRAKTYKEYQQYAEGFKRLVRRFKKKFTKCVLPPPPKFNPVYESPTATECQNGYKSGWKEGKNFARKAYKNGGFKKGGNKIADLLRTMPVSYENVYAVCRNSGAKEGYAKWKLILTNRKEMKKFMDERRLRKKMTVERMNYYQRLEEMLPQL